MAEPGRRFDPGSVPDRLARDVHHPDADSHIVVDQDVARRTGAAGILVRVCPAHVFSEAPDGTIRVEHAACLECGACLVVAPPGSLTWRYPAGGFGVAFREG